MKPITQQEIADYVQANIQNFHQRRLDSLQKLKLMNVVKRKNPYLFKAKNINTAAEFVTTLLDAHLSSQEEGIFAFCDADGNMLWEEIVKFNSAGTTS